LYSDDIAYIRDAWDELKEADDPEGVEVEWHDHLQGFTMVAPSDLQYRFSYLPSEVAARNGEFRLTADVGRMMADWDRCRQKEGVWPEWQLFWALHPIAEWLNDRVLGLFVRHEAPVLQVARGLQADESVFVLQGVLSNQRSQPVVVDWFGVVVRGQSSRVVPFADLARETGLTAPISNASGSENLDALSALLPAAVERARLHMRELRNVHGAGLKSLLADEEARIERWARESLARLEKSSSAVRDARRLEQERQNIEATVADRRRLIEQGLHTVDQPYVRLAAVLTPKE
jgi:hypothetical protein